MSKSLGNFVTIRDVLKEHKAEVLRFFLLSSHYRSPLVYTEDALFQAKQALTRFYTALRHLPEVPCPLNTKYEEQFIAAMDDDFNTPVALSILFDLAHEVNRLREQDMDAAASYAAVLKKLGAVLGVLQTSSDEFFQGGDEVDAVRIEALIAARQQARVDKQWHEADRIRDELASMDVAIEDGPQGTTWKVVK